MDIKAELEKLVQSIVSDPAKIESFKKDPVSAVKKILGDTAASDLVEQAVAAVKAKLAADDVSGIVGKLGGLFQK